MARVPLALLAFAAADSVTFCAVFQLAEVKVRLAPPVTVMPELPVPAVEVTVTLLVGCAASFTA